jgi:hypothetical protein
VNEVDAEHGLGHRERGGGRGRKGLARRLLQLSKEWSGGFDREWAGSVMHGCVCVPMSLSLSMYFSLSLSVSLSVHVRVRVRVRVCRIANIFRE